MRSQHEEHQQHRQRQDHEQRIAGDLVLIGDLRPFVADAAWQGFRQQALDYRLRLAGTVTRCRAAVDVRCREAVVTDELIRAIALRHFQDR
ncbi:hypothetical protein D3C81_1920650 [compost metagenome]